MSEKRRQWVSVTLDVAYYAIAFAFLIWAYSDHPPFKPWFWHSVMTTCQKTAYTVGRVGIKAEAAYAVAIDRVRQ